MLLKAGYDSDTFEYFRVKSQRNCSDQKLQKSNLAGRNDLLDATNQKFQAFLKVEEHLVFDGSS